ncbi:unnamed protein product [Closterium sp. NIES-54]
MLDLREGQKLNMIERLKLSRDSRFGYYDCITWNSTSSYPSKPLLLHPSPSYAHTTPLIARMLDLREGQKLNMIEHLKLEQQRVGREMREEIRHENEAAFAYIFSDTVGWLIFAFILYANPSQVGIMKLTGDRIFTNISDTGKAFVIILCSDIFLGYHSESGWETVVEMFLDHYGLVAEQNSIYIFVAIVPVTIDSFFKLWMHRGSVKREYGSLYNIVRLSIRTDLPDMPPSGPLSPLVTHPYQSLQREYGSLYNIVRLSIRTDLPDMPPSGLFDEPMDDPAETLAAQAAADAAAGGLEEGVEAAGRPLDAALAYSYDAQVRLCGYVWRILRQGLCCCAGVDAGDPTEGAATGVHSLMNGYLHGCILSTMSAAGSTHGTHSTSPHAQPPQHTIKSQNNLNRILKESHVSPPISSALSPLPPQISAMSVAGSANALNSTSPAQPTTSSNPSAHESSTVVKPPLFSSIPSPLPPQISAMSAAGSALGPHSTSPSQPTASNPSNPSAHSSQPAIPSSTAATAAAAASVAAAGGGSSPFASLWKNMASQLSRAFETLLPPPSPDDAPLGGSTGAGGIAARTAAGVAGAAGAAGAAGIEAGAAAAALAGIGGGAVAGAGGVGLVVGESGVAAVDEAWGGNVQSGSSGVIDITVSGVIDITVSGVIDITVSGVIDITVSGVIDITVSGVIESRRGGAGCGRGGTGGAAASDGGRYGGRGGGRLTSLCPLLILSHPTALHPTPPHPTPPHPTPPCRRNRWHRRCSAIGGTGGAAASDGGGYGGRGGCSGRDDAIGTAGSTAAHSPASHTGEAFTVELKDREMRLRREEWEKERSSMVASLQQLVLAKGGSVSSGSNSVEHRDGLDRNGSSGVDSSSSARSSNGRAIHTHSSSSSSSSSSSPATSRSKAQRSSGSSTGTATATATPEPDSTGDSIMRLLALQAAVSRAEEAELATAARLERVADVLGREIAKLRRDKRALESRAQLLTWRLEAVHAKLAAVFGELVGVREAMSEGRVEEGMAILEGVIGEVGRWTSNTAMEQGGQGMGGERGGVSGEEGRRDGEVVAGWWDDSPPGEWAEFGKSENELESGGGLDEERRKEERRRREELMALVGVDGEEGGAGGEGVITVFYETGWEQAFIHHSGTASGWTAVPGVRMKDSTAKGPAGFPLKVYSIRASSLEFVTNNGAATWDSQNPNQTQRSGAEQAGGEGGEDDERSKEDVFTAAAYGDLGKLRRLVEEEGHSIHATDGGGYSALQWSALNNKPVIATYLLDVSDSIIYVHGKGADVNAKDRSGQTALHWAAVRGGIAVADVLLQRGADVEVADSHGYRTTHVAAQYGQTAFLYHIVATWGGLADTTDNDGRTPLHWAAYKGFADPIRLLLFCDAYLSRPDKEGCTPLHWAAIRGNLDAVTLLVQAGSKDDLIATDSTGSMPAQLASDKGHRHVALFLSNARKVFDARHDTKGLAGKMARYGLAPVLWAVIIGLLIGFTNAVVFCKCLVCYVQSPRLHFSPLPLRTPLTPLHPFLPPPRRSKHCSICNKSHALLSLFSLFSSLSLIISPPTDHAAKAVEALFHLQQVCRTVRPPLPLDLQLCGQGERQRCEPGKLFGPWISNCVGKVSCRRGEVRRWGKVRGSGVSQGSCLAPGSPTVLARCVVVFIIPHHTTPHHTTPHHTAPHHTGPHCITHGSAGVHHSRWRHAAVRAGACCVSGLSGQYELTITHRVRGITPHHTTPHHTAMHHTGVLVFIIADGFMVLSVLGLVVSKGSQRSHLNPAATSPLFSPFHYQVGAGGAGGGKDCEGGGGLGGGDRPHSHSHSQSHTQTSSNSSLSSMLSVVAAQGRANQHTAIPINTGSSSNGSGSRASELAHLLGSTSNDSSRPLGLGLGLGLGLPGLSGAAASAAASGTAAAAAAGVAPSKSPVFISAESSSIFSSGPPSGAGVTTGMAGHAGRGQRASGGPVGLGGMGLGARVARVAARE